MSKRNFNPVPGRKWTDLPALYEQVELFPAPSSFRLRSLLKRDIAHNTKYKVQNRKYRGAYSHIVKAVDRG